VLAVRLHPHPLAAGAGTEILTWLDDHSCYALSVTAQVRVTGPAVLAAVRAVAGRHGPLASTLTDNGLVFTTRFVGGRGGRNALEAELQRLGIAQKNGRPNHPPDPGEVERFQQTMKNWLRSQARRIRRTRSRSGSPARRRAPPGHAEMKPLRLGAVRACSAGVPGCSGSRQDHLS
jgi:transposase InsO family protein